MTTRSNQIARRWFWIVGLLVAGFVIGVATILLWPDDGRLVAVSDTTTAEASVEPGGEENGVADEKNGEPNGEGGTNAEEAEGEGWFASSQSSAGGEAYAEHCAQCHGNDLAGGVGPALAGETFWQRWGGETVHAFYEVTRQTMPQGAPGSLTAETYADIAAHVLETNDFPPGESELPPEPDHLQTLVIERAATAGDAANEAQDDRESDAQEGEANGEQEPGPGADADAGDDAEETDAAVRDGEESEEDDRPTEASAAAGRGADADGDGWFSESQVRAGGADFSQHCARCHGAGLQGDPPLMGGGFPERWTSVWELYQYVSQTMPLDEPGLLDDRTYVDTVAFMLNENGYPTGEHRLTPVRNHMTVMRFDPSLAEAPDEVDRDEADRDEADRSEATEADRDEAGRDEADEADRDEEDAGAADADANGTNEAADDEAADANGNGASTSGWFTDDQAERGSRPYAQHCAECHGGDLQGDPRLVGERFQASFETVWDLFDYTRTQMPQRDPGSLDDETYADIAAFVLRGNEFPAGDEELDADDEAGMQGMPFDAAEGEGDDTADADAENVHAQAADAENGVAQDADAANGETQDTDAEDGGAARERPELGRAWLVLDTRPANVTINLIGPDGFTGRAVGGQTLQDLRPGSYVIAASRGHQSVMTTVVLGSGETGTVSLVLDELSRSGDVPTTPGTGEAEIPAIPRRPADDALIGEAPGATPPTAGDDRDADRDQDQGEGTGLHMRQVTQPRDEGPTSGGQLQSERGQHAYALHCARCHGVQLEGNVAPALGGAVFLERWQGHPVDWLYFQARASMPPHAPAILTEQTYADIIVFALSEAGVLDGQESFRPDDEAFRMLTIVPRGGLDDRQGLEDALDRLREAIHDPVDGMTLDVTRPLRPIEWPDDLGIAPVGYPGRIDAAAATEGARGLDAPDEAGEAEENGAGGAEDEDDEGDEENEEEEDANALPAARPTAGTG